MGMAHRGRLNVLAHILHKPYAQILAEFKDPDRSTFASRMELGWMGDVKYHEGARRAVEHDDSEGLQVIMAPNPSHLEHVNPVVEGMVRAADSLVDLPGETRYDHVSAMALVIHGDASFPGQGVVAETMNFSDISGYRTGGTIHIIANNQLGFTTPSEGGRSTLYASDLAKGFKIPIVHVNADDPEACVEVARLAFAYRKTFNKDFLIDLVGYRRYGHNEGDEPRFTQPRMYQVVDAHPPVREQWVARLVNEGVVTPDEAAQLMDDHQEQLRVLFEALDPEAALPPPVIEVPPHGAARNVVTRVDPGQLRAFNEALLVFPEGFTLHRRLDRILRRRIDALDEPSERTIDWGMAETLAYASILADGIAIRLTGEDAERGTFSHRHALLHDSETGVPFVPLQHLPQARASFEVRNSPLSENAAVAFEYGYNIQAPDRLCIWEAQYGDFINGAQAMIDEFVVSGRAKWEQTPSLVLLLPHGYEGQGPDHSTGRLERFLQLAAETNIRVANPTTSGQLFHLLRRQALLLVEDPLPLIVMTPKSLLRHPRAMSSLDYLANGRWQTMIDDPDRPEGAPVDDVRRLVFCSGKLFVDLVTSTEREATPDVALVRVEQLYPFPNDDVVAALGRYPAAADVVWAQEEPENMGAWEFMRPRLTALLGERPLRYIGRPRSASPAEGSTAFHNRRQAEIVARVFE
jgi:2-oxoglutarate dehydrogenase E1 component